MHGVWWKSVCASTTACLLWSEDNFSFTFMWVPGITLRWPGEPSPRLVRFS